MTSGDFCCGILHLFFSVYYVSDLVYCADEESKVDFIFDWGQTNIRVDKNLKNLGQPLLPS